MTDTRPALDLSLYHARHNAGDIQIFMTWLIHTGAPCIVLIPNLARVISHERVIPCVVPLASAWMWDEATGDGAHVARASIMFAENLGFSPFDTSKVLKITSIVRDLLGDLVSMPPMPAAATQVTAEAIITDNATGKVTEKEIRDHA